MLLHFFGAAREVTGSCYLLDTKGVRILIDCGLFQGSEFAIEKNHEHFPFDPTTIDAVILTHAHIDHNGRVPKLVHEGFRGHIFATEPTRELVKLMWEDAVDLMRHDHEKRGRAMVYHEEDVERAHRLVKGVPYGEPVRVSADVSFTFHDAGHILGSSFVRIQSGARTVVFSGDIGNDDVPVIGDTEPLGNVDYLITESTYGDRTHDTAVDRVQRLRSTVTEAIRRGGCLMIPAFSLERTQEILYEMNSIFEDGASTSPARHASAGVAGGPDPSSGRRGAITPPAGGSARGLSPGGGRGGGSMPRVPIFLDSPLAIKATDVYRRFKNYFDREAAARVHAGDDLFDFPGLKRTMTVLESKSINQAPNPKIILAGNGMLTGGRILHHAMRYLPDPNSTLLFVSYQGEGTLGRRIQSGARTVTIYGERVEVKAHVEYLGSYSAHGDQDKILRWIKTATRPPQHIYVTHGDPGSADAFVECIAKEIGAPASSPEFGAMVEV